MGVFVPSNQQDKILQQFAQLKLSGIPVSQVTQDPKPEQPKPAEAGHSHHSHGAPEAPSGAAPTNDYPVTPYQDGSVVFPKGSERLLGAGDQRFNTTKNGGERFITLKELLKTGRPLVVISACVQCEHTLDRANARAVNQIAEALKSSADVALVLADTGQNVREVRQAGYKTLIIADPNGGLEEGVFPKGLFERTGQVAFLSRSGADLQRIEVKTDGGYAAGLNRELLRVIPAVLKKAGVAVSEDLPSQLEKVNLPKNVFGCVFQPPQN